MEFSNNERYSLTERQLERFSERYIINPVTGCWEWTWHKDKDGYGKFPLNGKTARAHRVSYEHYKEVKLDSILDHYVCDNKSCVNPDHLRPSTHKENILRGTAPSAVNARRTICKNGHPFDAVYIVKGGYVKRRCTICHKLAIKAWRDKQKAAGRKYW